MSAGGIVAVQKSENLYDIAGLYLGRSGWAFAMGIDASCSRQRRLPDLPMETGISALVDELSAAAPEQDGVSRADGLSAGYRDFLSEVDRNVPPDLDVRVLCLQCVPRVDRAVRDWMAGHPRFSILHCATQELWADEIVRHLGSRSSRGIRPLTVELIKTLRRWTGTGAARDGVFTWVARPGQVGELTRDNEGCDESDS